jgi:ABC-type lipoprotein export system ATPase subunit
MVQLNRTNDQTFVWVTHSEEVGALAKRLIRMRDGLIVSDTQDESRHVDGVGPGQAAMVAARID